MKLAAIDIGSNAVRLLFIYVYNTKNGPKYVKDSMYRVPLRLGEEVFKKGKLSKKKIKDLVNTMIAFKKLMKVHQPVAYMACATSAMREAKNAHEALAIVLEKSGINIDVITGAEEAEMIFSNHVEQISLKPNQNYLYIDVGGGSTEIILMSKGEMIDKWSFNIGTLRIKHGGVSENDWQELDEWLLNFKSSYKNIIAIGSGGNINNILKYFSVEKTPEVDISVIRNAKSILEKLTVEERILQYNLKPDRADVITYAAQIYLQVMDDLNIKKMIIPKVGLADGMVHVMYEKIQKELLKP
jgi:exopolyphosphatase/guanosine-5'-triphosphate,3'-diphosphate pyrophosphatase